MRLDSTRLPRKALLPLGDTVLAGFVMRRLRALPADAYVLATDADGAKALAGVAEEAGFDIFEGPKDDVLRRYALVARYYGFHRIVRATGDNPFVSVPLARLALEESASREPPYDYVGLSGMPIGMGVEVVAAKALLEADERATQPYEREHVCPFLYGRPLEFSVRRPACPPGYRLPLARVTVDTEADYRRAQKLALALGPDPGDEAILSFLRDPEA